MLCNEPLIWENLERIVRSVARSRDWHEDLLQEALVHLWRTESMHPGHTTSWYLQNCRCYLCDCLRRGQSLDSPKRFTSSTELNNDPDESESVPECLIFEQEAVSTTCAHDALELLSRRLDSVSITILLFLTQGFNEREAGERVGLSQPAVRKRRLRIAALATALGIVPDSCSVALGV